MKKCVRCGEEKEAQGFPKDKKMKDGLNSWCKACRLEYKRTDAQLSKSRIAKRNARLRNHAAYRRTEKTRELKKYGLTYEQWEEMLAQQKYKCAIATCSTTHYTNVRGLNVDHCHKTGKTRQLLCSHCNTVLGKVNESLEQLDALKEYLIRHRS